MEMNAQLRRQETLLRRDLSGSRQPHQWSRETRSLLLLQSQREEEDPAAYHHQRRLLQQHQEEQSLPALQRASSSASGDHDDRDAASYTMQTIFERDEEDDNTVVSHRSEAPVQGARDFETGEWLEMENRLWMDREPLLRTRIPTGVDRNGLISDAVAATTLATRHLAAEAERSRERKLERAGKLAPIGQAAAAPPPASMKSLKLKKLKEKLDRLPFASRIRTADGRRVEEDETLAEQLISLVDMRDRQHARLLDRLEREEVEEVRRRKEFRRARANAKALELVECQHERERTLAQEEIQRLRSDNELALVARLVELGVLR
jgi:hypothetical protein